MITVYAVTFEVSYPIKDRCQAKHLTRDVKNILQSTYVEKSLSPDGSTLFLLAEREREREKSDSDRVTLAFFLESCSCQIVQLSGKPELVQLSFRCTSFKKESKVLNILLFHNSMLAELNSCFEC